MSRCEYCTEDTDGYVRGLDKNCHLVIYNNFPESDGKILNVNWYGKQMKVPINYCPICGRNLRDLKGE